MTRPNRVRCIALILALVLVSQTACGASDLKKLHDSLNKVARSLNSAAKTNRSLYENSMYGPAGSPEAIAMRQRGASAIHNANEKLIVALNLAQNLTEESFEQGKIAVIQALSEAAAELSTGNVTLDLILQSVATLINQSVAIIELFKSSDLRHALPEIRTWKLPEVYV